MVQVDLVNLTGCRIRLTLPAGEMIRPASPPLHLFGTVASSADNLITVTLEGPVPDSVRSATVSVDILHPDGLLRFQSTMHVDRSNGLQAQVPLSTATTMEWVQRRQHVRASVDLPTHWFHAHYDHPTLTEARLINLSVGGVAMRTTTAPEPGERIFIDLSPIPRLTVSTVLAEVLRSHRAPDGMHVVAVRLVDLPAADELTLDRFVATANGQDLAATTP